MDPAAMIDATAKTGQCACGKMKRANVRRIGEVIVGRDDDLARFSCPMRCNVCGHEQSFTMYAVLGELQDGQCDTKADKVRYAP